MAGRAKNATSRQRGFALLLFLLVLTMGALYVIVTRLAPLNAARLGRGESSAAALAQAKEALLGYAATYRDTHGSDVFGYLPCPDMTGDGNAAGSCGDAGETVVGLLPYKTLGLEELRDSAGGCLWYVVSASFKNNPRDGSGSTGFIPMNWDTQGHIALLDADANTVAAPNDRQGGAAAVLVAAGPPLPAQARTFDTAYRCGVAKPDKQYGQYLDGAYSLPATASAGSPLRLQQGQLDDAGNNDQMLAITPREIFSRVASRADFKNALDASLPGQINSLLNETKKALETRIWTDLSAMTSSSTTWTPSDSAPSHQADYGSFAATLIGDLPSLTPLAGWGASSEYDSVLDHWNDHLRYAVCRDLGASSPCLTVSGRSCRAVLLFAGQDVSGNPRTSARHQPAHAFTAPTSPSRASYLANYFESAGGLQMLDSGATTYGGATAYSDGARSSDIGICLSPQTLVSFSKDIASFRTANTGSANVATLSTTQATLGNVAASATSAGCIWYPSPLPFTSQLRAYFKFQIATRGEGFVFVIADAATNSAPPACGSATNAASAARLGYDGPGYPKIGLEFDTHSQTGSTCSASSSNRNDPSADHIAFVYWGSTASTSDDNCHGAGTSGSSSAPLNPRTLTPYPQGIATVKASDANLPYSGALPATTVHVRLDIKRSGNAYTLKAYVSDSFGTLNGAGDCAISDMQNLTQELADLCQKNVTIEQDGVAIAGSADLTRTYVGFTNAQQATSGSRQSVSISNLLVFSQ